MILGYQCDKCKAIVDEVQRVAVYLSDESAVLHDYWLCEDCLKKTWGELILLWKGEHLVEATGETKTVDIFKVVKKEEEVYKSKMGRR